MSKLCIVVVSPVLCSQPIVLCVLVLYCISTIASPVCHCVSPVLYLHYCQCSMTCKLVLYCMHVCLHYCQRSVLCM